MCRKLLSEVGMCFLFAQKYHTAMRYVGPIRRELGFRTVFNILGPLTNPARPEYFLLGVYDEYLVEPVAKVLASLGVRRAFVVYGQDKMDELSLSAASTVCELRDGYYRSFTLTPEELGLTRCEKQDLLGGTPEENAATVRAILGGEEQGPKRDAAVYNAAAALYITGKAQTLQEGAVMAAEVLQSGAALRVLDALVEKSNS